MTARMPISRRTNLTVPNVLTALRIAMAAGAAVCFIWGLAEREAAALCIVATLLDAFDGWYARTFSQCSELGKHLDPLADKLLMAVVFGLIAVRMQSVWIWVLVVLIAFREIAMTVFRAYSLRRHSQFIPASKLGKAKMIAQGTAGSAIIGYAVLWGRGFDFPVPFAAVPLALILLLSYLSAFRYLWCWNESRTRAGEGVVAVSAGFDESGSAVAGD